MFRTYAKKLAKEQGLSYDQLAEILKCSAPLICLMFKGERNFTPASVAQLMKEYPSKKHTMAHIYCNGCPVSQALIAPEDIEEAA